MVYLVGDLLFVPDAPLKAAIVEILLVEEQSISRLHRELANRGTKLHKLVLTGYLQSLCDVGILREKSIPPSKVYSVASLHNRNIYNMVGDTVADHAPKSERDFMTLHTLQTLFHRPIFRFELTRAGAKNPDRAVEVDKKSIQEARKIVARTGSKAPSGDPAYLLPDGHVTEAHRNMYNDILEELLLESTSSITLRKSTKQTQLTA